MKKKVFVIATSNTPKNEKNKSCKQLQSDSVILLHVNPQFKPYINMNYQITFTISLG